MRILVLGAGRMGLGAVHDLAKQPDVDEVTVADVAADRAHHVAAARRRRTSRRARSTSADHDDVVALMRGHACADQLRQLLAQRAARPRRHRGRHEFLRPRRQQRRRRRGAGARRRGARAAASTSSPTAASRPAWWPCSSRTARRSSRQLDEIHIRVGGLPQNPKPPLDYQLVFSVEGLINEYIERARVIRGGKIAESSR